MTILWWLGNLVWLLAVIPLVVWLLYRLLRPIEEIRRYVADVRDHGDALADELAAARALVATSHRIEQFAGGIDRYAETLEEGE